MICRRVGSYSVVARLQLLFSNPQYYMHYKQGGYGTWYPDG
jgi:hypothetical protein